MLDRVAAPSRRAGKAADGGGREAGERRGKEADAFRKRDARMPAVLFIGAFTSSDMHLENILVLRYRRMLPYALSIKHKNRTYLEQTHAHKYKCTH